MVVSMRKAVILVCWLMVCGSVVDARTAEDILVGVQRKLDLVKQYKSHYVQTTTSKSLPALNTEERGILYKKGETIRKEIQSPQPKVILITPERYYEKDLTTGEEKQLEPQADMQATMGQSPLKSMSPEDILRQFKFTLEGEDKASYILNATHQSVAMRIWVSKASEVLTRFQVMISDHPILTAGLQYKLVDGIAVLSQIDADIRMKLGTQALDVHQTTQYLFPELNPDLPDDLFHVP
jgi:outer membrane lipoprotein-sorting protein